MTEMSCRRSCSGAGRLATACRSGLVRAVSSAELDPASDDIMLTTTVSKDDCYPARGQSQGSSEGNAGVLFRQQPGPIAPSLQNLAVGPEVYCIQVAASHFLHGCFLIVLIPTSQDGFSFIYPYTLNTANYNS